MKSKITVDNNIMALPASTAKPVEHIQYLLDCIAPYSEPFTPLKSEALKYLHNNKRVCYLLHEGNATLHRRGDGMILISEKGPFLMGISNLQTQLAHLYVRPMENAKMSRISLERLSLVIEKEDL